MEFELTSNTCRKLREESQVTWKDVIINQSFPPILEKDISVFCSLSMFIYAYRSSI